MHEVGIMASTLDAIRQQAALHGAERVSRIVLRIGALSGVEPEALRFAYEALTPGTLAAGAVLDIELIAARAHCATCAADFDGGDTPLLRCPRCGNYSGDLRAGRELAIARLEFPVSS